MLNRMVSIDIHFGIPKMHFAVEQTICRRQLIKNGEDSDKKSGFHRTIADAFASNGLVRIESEKRYG